MDKQQLKDDYGVELWDQERIQAFRETVLSWYDANKRDLPWRATRDPYKIWISEIMLQQTQVKTVIPYYKRFLEAFPTVDALANAYEDDLLKVWEGLGYYSRARNMHTAAQQVVQEFGGVFPSDMKGLKSLRGIGPYTAGAIGSICFGLVEPAVDGNLMRVIARLFEVDLDVKQAKNRKVFQAIAEHLIDPKRPGDFNQALMDIGATICTPKNYHPERSPLKEFNSSYVNETWEYYPVTSKNKPPTPYTYLAIIVQDNDGQYLLEKRPSDGLLSNMWTYPLIDVKDLDTSGWKEVQPTTFEHLSDEATEQVEHMMKERYDLPLTIRPQVDGDVVHVFSHQKWILYLIVANLKNTAISDNIPDNCQWIAPDEFNQYTFPVVQQKLVTAYREQTLF
ncbi:A/G-specific adenine glycosylase [Dolosigranulum savutiense]|uniref:Adenine DNA glycosylase n=1 Tax=Dolosigranulum savutiense TaxID=3110288 RepID=A0AB74U2L3_9LACT